MQKLDDPRPSQDKAGFIVVFTSLTEAIHSASEHSVPKTKMSPYNKCWWNPELAALRQEKRHLCNKVLVIDFHLSRMPIPHIRENHFYGV